MYKSNKHRWSKHNKIIRHTRYFFIKPKGSNKWRKIYFRSHRSYPIEGLEVHFLSSVRADPWWEKGSCENQIFIQRLSIVFFLKQAKYITRKGWIMYLRSLKIFTRQCPKGTLRLDRPIVKHFFHKRGFWRGSSNTTFNLTDALSKIFLKTYFHKSLILR